MIKSLYIQDILNLTIENEPDFLKLKEQIDLLEINNIEYTESGSFIYFKNESNITVFKLSGDFVLDGLKIEITEFGIDAEANLFIKNGIIDYLEIFSINGIYPKIEPIHYKLSLASSSSQNRILER